MKILIVEDDKELAAAISRTLTKEEYDNECCYNGDEAVDFIVQYSYNLIILDRMLPKRDGVSVLKEIRTKGIKTPVIIVTALDGINDRIDGLDAGADDYLVKPFAMGELSARIRALLRRPDKLEENRFCSYGDLRLNTSDNILLCGEKSETLSKKESALMEFFMLNSGIVLKREQIILHVWGSEAEIGDGNLDNYIYFLRRRIKAVQSSASIKTVHGMGYRFGDDNA